MEEKQAIEILIQVAKLAQSKGVLLLDDAVVVFNCIKFLEEKEKQKQEQEQQVQEDAKLKKVK